MHTKPSDLNVRIPSSGRISSLAARNASPPTAAAMPDEQQMQQTQQHRRQQPTTRQTVIPSSHGDVSNPLNIAGVSGNRVSLLRDIRAPGGHYPHTDDDLHHEGGEDDGVPLMTFSAAKNSKPKPIVSLSLQAIVVVACTIFAFVTSFVSFYVQYDFFMSEYASQMESRMGYYTQMYGNQVNVASNSNASSLAHIASSAAFDNYDGVMTANPILPADYQWFIVHVNTMFAAGMAITFTFPLTGNTLVVTAGGFTAELCSNTFSAAGFQTMTWLLNQSFNLFLPMSAPSPCTDGRLVEDVASILRNGASFASPMMGNTSTATGTFRMTAAAVGDDDVTILFVMSAQFRSQTIVDWGSQAVPNTEGYYFDDHARLIATSRSDIAVSSGATLQDVPIPYVQYLIPKLGYFLKSSSSLRAAHFELDFDGFAWGTIELPLPTLSGRPWRLLLIDTTHSELTGNHPKLTGGGLIAAATVGSLLVCAVLFRIWFAPLSELADKVRRSATQQQSTYNNNNNKDDVVKQEHQPQRLSSRSFFTEIARAQDAFVNVQESLQEIQSYIPQTMQINTNPVQPLSSSAGAAAALRDMTGSSSTALVAVEDQRPQQPVRSNNTNAWGSPLGATAAAGSNDDKEMTAVATAESPKQHQRSRSSGGGGGGGATTTTTTNSAMGTSAANPTDLSLDPDTGNMLPCRMTALHLRLHRFAKWELIAPFLEMAATVICRLDGVLDTVDYGSITATFNCHKPCPAHEEAAVRAAIEIQRNAHTEAFAEVLRASPFSIGVDTDVAVALTVGFEDVKARVVIGTGFELCRRLSALAHDILKAELLITGSVFSAVPQLPALLVDYVQPRRETIQMLSAAAMRSIGVSGQHHSVSNNGQQHGAAAADLPEEYQMPDTRFFCAEDRKTIYEVPFQAPGSTMPEAAATSALQKYNRAFGDMREGMYQQAVERLQELLQVGGGLEALDETIRKHASRLWSICATRRTQANNNDSAVHKYVRLERCPWDVLPVEREICRSGTGGGGGGAPGCNSSTGGTGIGLGVLGSANASAAGGNPGGFTLLNTSLPDTQTLQLPHGTTSRGGGGGTAAGSETSLPTASSANVLHAMPNLFNRTTTTNASSEYSSSMKGSGAADPGLGYNNSQLTDDWGRSQPSI